MVEKNGLDTYVSEGDTFNHAEEVPCLDAISPNHSEEVSSLKSCILNRLRRHCAKSLMGPWANSQNVDIEEVGGGLSNYLYVATLKAGTGDVSDMTPTKVFIRVYGELLRSNMNSIILDAVLFALLSEKRLGPKLYGVFPGGRIEEFVESRYLYAIIFRAVEEFHQEDLLLVDCGVIIQASIMVHSELVSSIPQRVQFYSWPCQWDQRADKPGLGSALTPTQARISTIHPASRKPTQELELMLEMHEF
ncbi:Choline/ethanolamine kinase [Echinococcus granulosus]|uniref:Choline/ethanolamine kinase n=1 Tax=Echinococcus granulosus TaxID=6210 RepID=W6USN4_ECHGR|nr:Choline/ethanolamine kinase [Echinococcus granulosus]EUB64303.1 Choline/ethanolamine kinase [Echinococcus granulosus]